MGEPQYTVLQLFILSVPVYSPLHFLKIVLFSLLSTLPEYQSIFNSYCSPVFTLSKMIGFYNEGGFGLYRAKYLTEKKIIVIICDIHLCSLKSEYQLYTNLEDWVFSGVLFACFADPQRTWILILSPLVILPYSC